jgi:hypothetical protein
VTFIAEGIGTDTTQDTGMPPEMELFKFQGDIYTPGAGITPDQTTMQALLLAGGLVIARVIDAQNNFVTVPDPEACGPQPVAPTAPITFEDRAARAAHSQAVTEHLAELAAYKEQRSKASRVPLAPYIGFVGLAGSHDFHIQYHPANKPLPRDPTGRDTVTTHIVPYTNKPNGTRYRTQLLDLYS